MAIPHNICNKDSSLTLPTSMNEMAFFKFNLEGICCIPNQHSFSAQIKTAFELIMH